MNRERMPTREEALQWLRDSRARMIRRLDHLGVSAEDKAERSELFAEIAVLKLYIQELADIIQGTKP